MEMGAAGDGGKPGRIANRAGLCSTRTTRRTLRRFDAETRLKKRAKRGPTLGGALGRHGNQEWLRLQREKNAVRGSSP